jgi:hypothetical protein
MMTLPAYRRYAANHVLGLRVQGLGTLRDAETDEENK